MKRMLALGVVLLASGAAIARARDAKEDVKNGAKKLADQASYSWTSATTGTNEGKDPQEKGTTQGKTQKDGCTHLLTDKGGKATEAAVKGDKVAVKTAEGWKNAGDFDPAGDAKGKLDKSLVLAQSLKKYKTPADQVAVYVDWTGELASQGDGLYTGTFTAEGVKAYLESIAKAGAKPSDLAEPKVTVKFWLKDGTLAKYEITLDAKKPKGKDKTLAGTKTTIAVEIKDVGSTKTELADDCLKKLQ
jgi:hypothetical protein